MNRVMASLVYALVAIVLTVAAYFNYVELVEAFGSGAPYYSRTTNRDQWSNSVPMLILVDPLVLVSSCSSKYLRWSYNG